MSSWGSLALVCSTMFVRGFRRWCVRVWARGRPVCYRVSFTGSPIHNQSHYERLTSDSGLYYRHLADQSVECRVFCTLLRLRAGVTEIATREYIVQTCWWRAVISLLCSMVLPIPVTKCLSRIWHQRHEVGKWIIYGLDYSETVGQFIRFIVVSWN